MPYENTQDLKNDILFRASESTASSEWNVRVINYLNRVYRTLCSGASEFLPEYVDDWWWLRRDDVLTVLPVTQTGTVAVTANSTSITFSSAPAVSVAGYRLRIDGHPDVFEIATHTGGAAAATLDSVYTGDTSGAATYTLMKVKYDLAADCSALIAPMFGYRNNTQIIGLSPERMDELFPLSELSPGVPKAFAMEDVRTVRFSHGGMTDDRSMRIEYRYRPVVTDLEDDSNSIPLVPLEWRHLLTDMALTYVFLDKNDDRSNAVALSARTGLAGMLKENRRRLSKVTRTVGRIYPRGDVPTKPQGPLRTNSGLIIG